MNGCRPWFMFICIQIYNLGLLSRPTSSSWGRLGKYVYLTAKQYKYFVGFDQFGIQN